MVRLVTAEDIAADPELSKKGISINQYHDFGDEDLDTPEPLTQPKIKEKSIPPVKEETKKAEVPKVKAVISKQATKAAPKKNASKSKK